MGKKTNKKRENPKTAKNPPRPEKRKNRLGIGLAIAATAVGSALWFGYPTNHYFEDDRTVQETAEVRPYPIAWSEENSQIYILGFAHGSELRGASDEINYQRQHSKRVVSTLKHIRSLGVKNLILEGATDELIDDFRKAPNRPDRVITASTRQGSEGGGDAEIYVQVIFDYLGHSDWNVIGLEDPEIFQKRGNIEQRSTNIVYEWQNKMLADAKQRLQKAKEDGLTYDQTIGIVDEAADDYTSKMREEMRQYFMDRGGSDWLYNLDFTSREDYTSKKILPIIESGEKAVILIGAAHAPNLHSRYENIPHTIFSVDGKMPEAITPQHWFNSTVNGRKLKLHVVNRYR